MSHRFYFGDDSDSDSSADLSTLPYPKPLNRSDFLSPTFNPTTYLSQLQENRHQTLEDLRSELRTRSQELNKELLDLVNENYQDFLSLGTSLKGGDEKVEEVRLALLGFQREVVALKGKVTHEKGQVEALVQERKDVRERIQFGRGLLELDRRVDDLEQRLMLVPKHEGDKSGASEGEEEGQGEDSEDESADGEDEEDTVLLVKRLRRHTHKYVCIRRLAEKLGLEHNFVANQGARRAKLREALLLDMGSAMKRAVQTDGEQRKGQLHMIETYELMGAGKECMKALKEAEDSEKNGMSTE